MSHISRQQQIGATPQDAARTGRGPDGAGRNDSLRAQDAAGREAVCEEDRAPTDQRRAQAPAVGRGERNGDGSQNGTADAESEWNREEQLSR